jgi:hypothetical protein
MRDPMGLVCHGHSNRDWSTEGVGDTLPCLQLTLLPIIYILAFTCFLLYFEPYRNFNRVIATLKSLFDSYDRKCGGIRKMKNCYDMPH